MTKGKTQKQHQKKDAPLHPWTEIASQTSFDFDMLEVLADHHRILAGFCSEPTAESSDINLDQPASESSTHSSTIGLSFAQYCLSLSTLIFHGSASQQFEYLFHAYAIESERGITRAELFQMLQDHFYNRSIPKAKPSHMNIKNSEDTDTRHFERLYTWLKKHMVVYDRNRCGFLPLPAALEMLRAHPSALHHFQLRIDPLIQKLQDNDNNYREKSAAAQTQ